jgi:hypothetical protein
MPSSGPTCRLTAASSCAQGPEEDRRQRLLRIQHLRHASGSSYGTGAIVHFAEANPALKAAGKWNTMELTANKRQLVLTMNGTKTAETNNGFFEEGHFTLQWGGGVVKFRKVAVKTL